MPSVTEVTQSATQMNSGLQQGLRTLSNDQEITFVKYVKLVLPMDGYVFWVKADLVNPSAVYNSGAFDTFYGNQVPSIGETAQEITVKGSLHVSIDQRQAEDEIFAYNKVIFTTSQEITDLNEISPQTVYIGSYGGIRFSFSQRGKFYDAAGLYHYVGDAIYPVMDNLVIDDPIVFDVSNVIISNSLPIWLTLNKYFPVYPSFAVPDNIVPPYAAVHIPPEGTEAIQSTPYIDGDNNHYQLAKDKVRITVYGLRNFNALDFVDYVNQYTLDTDNMGIMNMPIIRDEKRSQNELSVLAMKKSIEYEVSYYQSRVRDIAKQYIENAFITFL